MTRTHGMALSLTVMILSVCSLANLPAQAAEDSWLGPAPTGMTYPAGEETRRFNALSENIKLRAKIQGRAPQTFRTEALILDTDRDPLDIVLRRTKSLLNDIAVMPDAPDMTRMSKRLAGLKAQAEKTDVKSRQARRALFDKVCHLRRKIAFSNPLLDFDEIFILKRQLPPYNHMCDQYYGLAQAPGGGLYVISDPFGKAPGIRNVLTDSVVANGRLKGQRLSGGPKRKWKVNYNGVGGVGGDETQGGSFLSPDLSFDGKNIVFAYVECEGDRQHRYHTDHSKGHWAEGRCYHIFSVQMDGTNLRMLTDGTFNDFDPCFMPSGRIAFISERRGGYLRCGRVCPTYTLYDMAEDGSGISCLSYHETNEWHPSVSHDGMILWTRWDYVDRHGVTAHMPWITTPDGRDPRAVHGNYSPRFKRPDMETDPRSIPGSHKIIAVASPHHDHSLGALVLIDPRVKDDDLMGPVKRLTPEISFPESEDKIQRRSQDYGQPWPLSENYYICAYEPAGGRPPARNYGIYLVDAFGNKELIYRDPDIACQTPIPVKARPVPPILPEMSQRLAKVQSNEATVGIVNVYDTSMPFPKGTKIKALRIYQIFPLSVASARVTHATGYQIPQATDSINLTRAVLGTVPVEEDGSAHFIVPAKKELFFQVLDEKGLAVTSMRSGTHFQPGERSMCQGCHEPKYEAPVTVSDSTPMAMKRPASRPTPEGPGTNPFSYPQLVQPVLDKYCVKCHADPEQKAPPLDDTIMTTDKGSYMNPKTPYFASYLTLTPEFGFYNYGGKNWEDPKWYRTTPGEFGAKASKLYELLQTDHYGVKLPPEALHRITLWLDSCSPFYGVYEKEGGQAQLRGEVARPTLE